MPRLVQDGWMSAPEAARRLGLQLHTVHALIDRGELAAEIVPPGKRSTGRRRDIRISREALDDYIERARVNPGDLAHLYPPGGLRLRDTP